MKTPTRKRKSPSANKLVMVDERYLRELKKPSAKRLHVWSLVNEGDGRARVVFQQTGGARWVLIEPGNYGKEAVRFLNAAIKEHALATRSLSRRKAPK